MRQLRTVNGDEVLGTVDIKNQKPVFTGAAAETFETMRRFRGELQAARELLRNGWSNGYVYLSDNT